MSQPSTVPFTSQEAFATLQEVCQTVGLVTKGARLIRLGENAVFVLAAENVIVRIARSLAVIDDVRKEVAVSAWLRDQGVPAARTTDHEQPLVVRRKPVTLWHFIDNDGSPVSLMDLAAALRSLHQLPVPADLLLPKLDLLRRVPECISVTNVLSDEERQFLLKKYQDLQAAYEGLAFIHNPCAVHGDAHDENVIKARDGSVVFIDFECFSFGPPETDLGITAIERTLGWRTRAEYDGYAERYGFDVLTWEGYPIIRDMFELKMTTWLMQNVSEDRAIAQEFRHRLFCLQNPDAPRRWHAF
ncbi:phosphotransferase [Nonomuraea sp. NPDC004702]